MGNLVIGEALRQGMSCTHYAMLHAATSASCYNDAMFSYPVTNAEVLTADTDPEPPVKRLGYSGWLGQIGGGPINFRDDQDSVLGSAWNFNNNRFKPQVFSGSFYTGRYYYDRSLPVDQRLGVTFLNRAIAVRAVSEQAEAKAYADYSLTGAIGFNETQGGSIQDSVDDSYLGDDHGAEWNWKIQDLSAFYNALLLKFGLPRNP